MKRFLPFMGLIVLCAFGAKAQIYFTQNFSSSANYADYVEVPGIADKFTHTYAGSKITRSINNGKLRIARDGTAGVNADYLAGFVRTSNSGGTATANFAGTAPAFLKVSFEFNITGTNPGAGLLANLGFIQIGQTLSATSTSTPYAEIAPSLTAGTTNGTDYTYVFSRPSGAGNAGTGQDRTTTITGAQQFTWYLNNTGSSISYTGPDGVTVYTLADDTWDLFSGNTLILDDRTATTPTQTMQNIGITFRGLQNAFTADFDNIEISQPTYTLPVSLVSFIGKAANFGNALEWRTASESNNSHFEVLRSKDGGNFVKIGQVAGKGNSSVATNYSFTDRSPLAGVNYYQLKQVDNDGTAATYTPVVVKALNKGSQFSIVSKQGDQLEISYDAENADNNASIKIYDLNGKVLLNKAINLEKGFNTLSLSAQLPNGLLVAVIKRNQQNYSTKFIR